jgi:hypothetical protein
MIAVSGIEARLSGLRLDVQLQMLAATKYDMALVEGVTRKVF